MPNESLIHADIFFLISTIALVIISIGLCVVIFYVIRVLKNVREFTDKVREEGEEMIKDIRKFRGELRDEGLKWKYVADMVRNFFARKPARPESARSSGGAKARRIVDKVIK